MKLHVLSHVLILGLVGGVLIARASRTSRARRTSPTGHLHPQPGPARRPRHHPRELEILTLIAQGLSNREIADRLFVSENTVKTHCSRAFDKLGARRRTQAVQLGKQLGLLP
ncbi:response regulator transcription factor [Tunturiibacter gelidiferens]|uniref:response regulator transcription factor n=1 Tax=Tunturiibacter gelidiferens TaxID=3069689 RepID=UPI003D9BFD7A